MSNVAHLNNGQEVAAPDMQAPYATHTANMLMNPQIMQQLHSFAALMASGKSTVPQHLQGNTGDCMAIAMQAAQWGMNPFAVAQKTHTVQGTLGYEAQLVNAVITSMAPTKDRLRFEWFGDWSRVIGCFVEKTSKNGNKYIAPNWTLAQEKGLGVKVWATLHGEDEPRVLELLLSQAQVRNSTLWASDPKQQLAYLAIKRWARLYCPDVILGVYTPDELDKAPPPEREINPAPSEAATSSQASSLRNRVHKTRHPEEEAVSSNEERQQESGASEKPVMPNFDEPDDASMPPVDELLKHLPNCTTGPDLSEWKQDAMTWPDGSSERQQLVEAYNTHLANLKAQSTEGAQ